MGTEDGSISPEFDVWFRGYPEKVRSGDDSCKLSSAVGEYLSTAITTAHFLVLRSRSRWVRRASRPWASLAGIKWGASPSPSLSKFTQDTSHVAPLALSRVASLFLLGRKYAGWVPWSNLAGTHTRWVTHHVIEQDSSGVNPVTQCEHLWRELLCDASRLNQPHSFAAKPTWRCVNSVWRFQFEPTMHVTGVNACGVNPAWRTLSRVYWANWIILAELRSVEAKTLKISAPCVFCSLWKIVSNFGHFGAKLDILCHNCREKYTVLGGRWWEGQEFCLNWSLPQFRDTQWGEVKVVGTVKRRVSGRDRSPRFHHCLHDECVGVWQERERDTHTETETERQRQTDRKAGRQTDRQTKQTETVRDTKRMSDEESVRQGKKCVWERVCVREEESVWVRDKERRERNVYAESNTLTWTIIIRDNCLTKAEEESPTVKQKQMIKIFGYFEIFSGVFFHLNDLVKHIPCCSACDYHHLKHNFLGVKCHCFCYNYIVTAVPNDYGILDISCFCSSWLCPQLWNICVDNCEEVVPKLKCPLAFCSWPQRVLCFLFVAIATVPCSSWCNDHAPTPLAPTHSPSRTHTPEAPYPLFEKHVTPTSFA